MQKDVNKEIFPYLEAVMERRNMPFTQRRASDADHVCINLMSTSGKAFHRAVARAVCEKRNAEDALPSNATYWKPGVEKEQEIKAENPEFQFLIDLRNANN